MKVILISGHAGHGKDTVASMLRELLEADGGRVLIAHYADLVKYVSREFFGWDGKKDEKGRSILQYVGTDVARKKNPDVWVQLLRKLLWTFEDCWDYVLIPDTRFPNEVTGMRRLYDTVHLRVNRPNFESPLTEEQKRHPSETSLDGYPADYTVENSGDLAKLRSAVEIFLKEALYETEAQRLL